MIDWVSVLYVWLELCGLASMIWILLAVLSRHDGDD